jgi:hypothetical protein
LIKEIMTLKEIVQERDDALSGTGRESETLRATVRDKDETLRAAEKAHGELRDQIVGWQTHAKGKFLPNSDLNLEFLCFADLIS